MCIWVAQIAGEVVARFFQRRGLRVLAVELTMLLSLEGLMHAQTGFVDASKPVDSSVQQTSSDEEPMPLPTNLETGTPLDVVLSPFRVGRLSLLSFSAFQGYDVNPMAKQVAPSTEFTALNALLVYSIRKAEWNVDFQYEPSAVISPSVTEKNIAANAVDLQAERQLNATWRLGLGDHFHYTPNVQSSIQGSNLSVNLGGGISLLIPFLTTNQSLLYNTLDGSLNHRFSSRSNVTFFAEQSFVRLSHSINLGRETELPSSEALSFSGSLSYFHTVSPQDSFSANYDYRTQYSPDFPSTAQFNTASFGWSHSLAQGLRMTLSGGPGLWKPGSGQNQLRETVQGTFELSKQFGTRGSIGTAVSRNDFFSGAVTNTFSNDYTLRTDRRFGTRVRFTASGAYVQQHVYPGRILNATTATFEPSWNISRNWATFGQVRYIRTQGTDFSLPPQKIFTAGIRWSWVPEKP